MDLLCAVAPRWKSAELHIPSLSALIQRIQPVSLPSLTALVIQTDGVPDAAEIQTLSLSIPWAQLTSLTLGLASRFPDHCLRALVQCTSLVSAEFETEGWERVPNFSSMERATLAKLTSLKLSFVNRHRYRWQQIMPFLDQLALPALRVLRLRLNKRVPWTGSTLAEFQLRSQSLDFLEISDCSLQSDDFKDVLENWPALRELEMINCPDAFEDELIIALPTLLRPNYDIHEVELDEMIASRWWTKAQLRKMATPPPVARWKSIYISIQGLAGGFSKEFSAGIKNYRAQGLDVTVDWTVKSESDGSDCEGSASDGSASDGTESGISAPDGGESNGSE
ncbi:hypothetical protein FB45DRAFT_898238 [Roridomyces roridus]|uniref:F-box domain-containing protein n=1 Tax=Roridomyces roridus TaxID=1738132 RepID=A0AAD7CE28_9AGAR|nr:hypothetical protein FB45DRAFT_898238 [Roridomyces roridus]